MHGTAQLVLLASTLLLTFSGRTLAQDASIKIGHAGPLSGTAAHLGKDNENGARMAIDEVNSKGITIGGKKVKFVLLAEDDAGDPKQSKVVAQKLVDASVSGVVGHLNSGTTLPASKIYFDAGIPQITPSATATKYTQHGFNTAFRMVANDGQLGGTLGRYAAQVSKAKKIAVIDDRTPYGQGVAEEFVAGVKSQKGSNAEIVATQYTNDKATDFNAILTAIKARNPDLIFFGGMDAVAGPLLKQMKALGINVKFMGGDGMCTGKLADLAGAAMADQQVVCAEAGGVDASGQKGMDAFRANYKNKYGIDVQIYAPYAYDAVMLMVEAMKKADSADPAKYRPFLQKIQYKGVSGSFAFDSKGDIKDGTLTLYTYKNGRREVLTVTK